jgi:hypothetical protein
MKKEIISFLISIITNIEENDDQKENAKKSLNSLALNSGIYFILIIILIKK